MQESLWRERCPRRRLRALNAERLHAIAVALRADLDATEQHALVQQLAESLQRQVQDPAQPSHGVETSTLREQLNERLASARSNGFSDAWRLTLEELGVTVLPGHALRQWIHEIFLRNEITISVAADAVAEVAERLERFRSAIDQLIASMEYLGIGAEELPPGAFEIGFLIPRSAVDNELEELGKELVELKEILGPVQELATGTRSKLTVRMISSSGFQVFLDAAPDVALVLSQIVESLLSSYEKIRQIRKGRSDMKDAGVPDGTLAPIQDYANTIMDVDIQALAEKLIEEHGRNLRGGEGRGHRDSCGHHALTSSDGEPYRRWI